MKKLIQKKNIKDKNDNEINQYFTLENHRTQNDENNKYCLYIKSRIKSENTIKLIEKCIKKDSIPGGILVYGIPDFRLSKNLVKDIIDKIKIMGANIILNTEFGKDINLSDLKEKYDYIFLGLGAPNAMTYPLTENSNSSIYESDVFLKKYSQNEFIKNLGTVVVIGVHIQEKFQEKC